MNSQLKRRNQLNNGATVYRGCTTDAERDAAFYQLFPNAHPDRRHTITAADLVDYGEDARAADDYARYCEQDHQMWCF
jgi:hypothetical protein